jgi:PAS domain S-box-containing protein
VEGGQVAERQAGGFKERRKGERRGKAMAEALRQSEAKFATVFRACPDLISITEKATGRYMEVNDAFERIMGFTKAEVVGRSSLDLGTWGGIENRAQLMDALAGAARLENFETTFRRKSGEAFTALISVELIHLDGQDCLITVGRDISGRKQEEELLRRSAEELQRSNMDLERFAFIAAHDLLEPCRTICSFAQMLQKRYSRNLDQAGREFLDFLVQGAQRMRDLISGMLATSQAGMSAIRRVDIPTEDWVQGVLDDLTVALDDCHASVTVGGLPPTIRGDMAQLRQLLINLVGNAIKFQADHGQPRVEIGGEALRQGGWRFWVSDNGIGVPGHHAEDIFAPFKRLHGPDRYPGAGVGLSVARRIVEAHGGRIHVEPVAGGGSRFVFTLAG